MTDNLSQLLARPLQPLREQWYSALRDVVEHGGPQGDTSAMEDLAGLQAVQQAVAAEAAPSA